MLEGLQARHSALQLGCLLQLSAQLKARRRPSHQWSRGSPSGQCFPHMSHVFSFSEMGDGAVMDIPMGAASVCLVTLNVIFWLYSLISVCQYSLTLSGVSTSSISCLPAAPMRWARASSAFSSCTCRRRGLEVSEGWTLQAKSSEGRGQLG